MFIIICCKRVILDTFRIFVTCKYKCHWISCAKTKSNKFYENANYKFCSVISRREGDTYRYRCCCCMYVDCLQCQPTLLLFPLPISCFILAKRRGHAQFLPDCCYYRIVFVFSALLYFLNWSVSNRSTIYSRAVLHKLYVWRRCASAGQNTMPEIATFDRRWVIMQVFFLLSFAVINRHTNSATLFSILYENRSS